MKRRDKHIIKNMAAMISAMLLLLCGALALEIGQQAKAIVLIMCSLYVVILRHAGIVSTAINAKNEDEGKSESRDN